MIMQTIMINFVKSKNTHKFICLVLAIMLSAPAASKSKYSYDSYECSKLTHKSKKRLINIEEIFQNILEYSDIDGTFSLCPVSGPKNIFFEEKYHISITENYIKYDTKFFETIKNNAGYWVIAGILSHELAHYILGHTQGEKRTSSKEKSDADYMAGIILQKSGASIDNTIELALSPFSKNNENTYSNKESRVNSFKQGWLDACDGRPTPQCPNYEKREVSIFKNPDYTETDGFLDLLKQSENYKGREIASSYCKLYASVSIKQAHKNNEHFCGYPIDAYANSRWSLIFNKQYDWCMNVSAHATQKETLFREKKLKLCIDSY